MASNSWAVTTEKLTTAANYIEEQTGKFKTDYLKLYAELSNLKSAQWQGIASDTFNSKLEGYRTNFETMEKTLKDFASGLTTRATNYEGTENALKDAADAL